MSDVSITKRILFAVTVPVLLVVGLAYGKVDSDLERYREAARLVDVSDHISSFGDADHLIQWAKVNLLLAMTDFAVKDILGALFGPR